MKLKCVRHNRCVHVLSEGKTVHREDGTHCPLITESTFDEETEEWHRRYFPSVYIGQQQVAPYKVWLMQRNKNRRWRTNHKQGQRQSVLGGRL